MVRLEGTHGNPDTQAGTGFYVAAYSGKDGARLRQSKPNASSLGSAHHRGGRGVDFDYPCLEWCADLNGDGVVEVLHTIWENNYYHLGAFSGRDGELLWRIPFKEGSFIPRRFAGQQMLHDLNGDGVPDVVLWVPTKIDRDNPWAVPVELRAYDGRDGKPLWTKGVPHESIRPVIPPLVGDLDGDGFPEVIIYRAKQEARMGAFQTIHEIAAIDGRDGKTRWTWTGNAGRDELLFPLVADLDGKGRKSVCFAYEGPLKEIEPLGRSEGRIVVLDGKGQVRTRIPVKDLYYPSRHWAAFDLDGDGKEELLFFTHDQLCAVRGDGSYLWKWKLPRSHTGAIVDLFASKGNALAVRNDREVYGLDAATGKPRWRSEVPGNPNAVRVLPTRDARGLPQLVGEWHNQGQWNTVSRQTWPTTPTGAYLPPKPEPLAYAQQDEIGWPRPLPWAPVFGASSLDNPRRLIPLTAVVFFVGWLVYLALTGRWRRLALLFALSVVIAVALALISFRFDREPMAPEDYYSWSGWYLIWFWAVGVVVAGLILWVLLKSGLRVSRQLFRAVKPGRVSVRE